MVQRFQVIVLILVGFFSLYSVNAYSQSVIKWEDGAKHSTVSLDDGVENQTITVEGLRLSASLIERKGGILHAYLTIENTGSARLDFDPAECFLSVQDGSNPIRRPKDPEELASSLVKRGADAVTRDQLRNKSVSKNATITRTDGPLETIVARQDAQAVQRDLRDGRRKKQALESAGAYVRTSSLRVDTLLPGNVVDGNLWFDGKGPKKAVLSIKIGTVTYEFPFVKLKE
ncbi:MAG: hypothetical protein ABI999_17480 [Acidobacteriota bacterium]